MEMTELESIILDGCRHLFTDKPMTQNFLFIDKSFGIKMVQQRRPLKPLFLKVYFYDITSSQIAIAHCIIYCSFNMN